MSLVSEDLNPGDAFPLAQVLVISFRSPGLKCKRTLMFEIKVEKNREHVSKGHFIIDAETWRFDISAWYTGQVSAMPIVTYR